MLFSSSEPKAPEQLIGVDGSVCVRPSTISNDFSSETTWPIVNKSHMPSGPLESKSYSNGHSYMAANLIYIKSLKRSSPSPEPIKRWLWSLVCSFGMRVIQRLLKLLPWVDLNLSRPSLSSNLVTKAFAWEKVKLRGGIKKFWASGIFPIQIVQCFTPNVQKCVRYWLHLGSYCWLSLFSHNTWSKIHTPIELAKWTKLSTERW